MATYTKTTDFLAKDSLPLNNAAKYVKGSEIDTEFNNIATADADNLKISALGTSVETALGVAIGSSGAPVLFNGALGTPSSGTATNITGLPIASGVSGLGANIATALAVAVGSAGAPVVLNGALGTPTSGTLTNATGLPAAGVVGTAAILGANTFTAIQRWAKGADVASAGALTLGTDGNYFDITGTTSITSIGTAGIGTWVRLHFDGALTLTHHATDLILPGAANITTAAGDEAEFIEYASGDWRCVSYTKASGAAVVSIGITLGTSTATTSGTSIDFTGIPSTAKRITVNLKSVSTDGTSVHLIQLGDSGGVETSSYDTAASTLSSGAISASYTTGFGLRGNANVAAHAYSGTIIFSLEESSTNQWIGAGALAIDGTGATILVAGYKALSATLDRVRLTTVNGTNTFDAGEVNITYE